MSSVGIPLGPFIFPVNVTNRSFLPNRFNACLDRETCTWEGIQRVGGLQAICPGTECPSGPPWVKMPPQARRFSQISSIALPNATGTDNLVLSFIVPIGYDGVAVTVVNNYTGQGFVEGSGDLTWRIQLNMRYAKNYGNITTSLGSLTIPTNIGNSLFMQSGQLVQYFVNRSVASAPDLIGGRIICALLGWWWPR
jgi:hypothetical protein